VYAPANRVMPGLITTPSLGAGMQTAAGLGACPVLWLALLCGGDNLSILGDLLSFRWSTYAYPTAYPNL